MGNRRRVSVSGHVAAVGLKIKPRAKAIQRRQQLSRADQVLQRMLAIGAGTEHDQIAINGMQRLRCR